MPLYEGLLCQNFVMCSVVHSFKITVFTVKLIVKDQVTLKVSLLNVITCMPSLLV